MAGSTIVLLLWPVHCISDLEGVAVSSIVSVI